MIPKLSKVKPKDKQNMHKIKQIKPKIKAKAIKNKPKK